LMEQRPSEPRERRPLDPVSLAHAARRRREYATHTASTRPAPPPPHGVCRPEETGERDVVCDSASTGKYATFPRRHVDNIREERSHTTCCVVAVFLNAMGFDRGGSSRLQPRASRAERSREDKKDKRRMPTRLSSPRRRHRQVKGELE
jgi:hypothetical protein